jgi:two-component system, sensor histidine kinase LadS
LVLRSGFKEYDLGHKVRILQDPAGALSIKEVSSPAFRGRFLASSGRVPTFGISSDVLWLEFTILDQASGEDWLLEIGHPLLDHISLYTPLRSTGPEAARGYRVLHAGDALSFDAREIPHRNFVFELPTIKGGNATCYLRIQTQSSMLLRLTVWEREEFRRQDQNALLLLGIYYGVLLVMLFYNFFLFLSLKDAAYLCYVLSIASYMLFQGGLNGLTYQYLWPGSPWFNNAVLPASLFATTAFSVLFAGVFLGIRTQLRGALPLYQGIFCCSLLFMLLSFVIPYGISMKVGTPLAILAILIVLVTGVVSWLRNFKPARFFLIAWMAFLAGQLISALNRGYGLLPSNSFTLYCGQIGSALEVVLLALALADRIKVVREERQLAQERALEALRTTDMLNDKLLEYNRNLEQMVEERTMELTMANERLREMDRLKSDFLANVSHELRTPLTSIIGFAEIIRERVREQLAAASQEHGSRFRASMNKVLRFIDIIASEGDRLTRLINDVLDLSKLEAGKVEWQMESNDIAEIVDASLNATSPLFEQKGLEVLRHVEQKLPLLCCDRDRIVQVCINLLANAVKFTQNGSVCCSVQRRDNTICIAISDTGPGISSHDLESIFDKFKQSGDPLTAKPKGSGLGLSICRQIVTHHGGDIQVRSTLGQGSTFIVSLPLHPHGTGDIRA